MCFWRPLSAPDVWPHCVLTFTARSDSLRRSSFHNLLGSTQVHSSYIVSRAITVQDQHMRVCYVLLAATAAFLANSAVVSANPGQSEDSKLISGDNAHKRLLRGEAIKKLLEHLPESLEEYVEHHHHIREILTRWCLEDHEPEEAMKEKKAGPSKRSLKTQALYKEFMAAKGLTGRKLTVVECNL